MDDDDAGSADDALYIEQVDESEYEGRLGGFLSDHCSISVRFYRDGSLEGFVQQRKKPQLHGLSLLSTSSRKRKRPSDDANADENDRPIEDENSVLCGYIQGRWMRRGDGRVGHFHAMKRRGHVDRQSLQCRAEFFYDGSASGTWRVSGGGEKKNKNKRQEADDDEETESDVSQETEEEDDESLIENGFDWKCADNVKHEDSDGTAIGDGRQTDPLAVYPLSPGTYHFRGCTTYHTPEPPQQPRTKQKKKKAEPPRDECFVTMELFPDGTLVGKSREVLYPQSCPIRGTWEVGRLRYVLEFKVRGAVGFFKYSARVGDPGAEDGEVEAARTLKGKWRNIDDNEGATPGYTGGRGQFELTCVYRSNTVTGQESHLSSSGEGGELEAKASQVVGIDDGVQIVDQLLGVFTTGRYVLKGKAIDDDGYEYESQLDIELFDDGKVKGTCRELVYHQVQRLHGNWTRTAIQYELEYVVKKEVGHYFYKGRLESDGLVLHGAWCNMELLLETPPADQAVNYRGEKGKFSYAILESTRRWSHMSHSDFPKPFRDRVRCILLCSQRTHVLPSALWGKIFAFCSHEWFQSTSWKVKEEVKTETRAS